MTEIESHEHHPFDSCQPASVTDEQRIEDDPACAFNDSTILPRLAALAAYLSHDSGLLDLEMRAVVEVFAGMARVVEFDFLAV